MLRVAKLLLLSVRYAISVGVRKRDEALKGRLDSILIHERTAIRSLLRTYGVPLVQLPGGAHE
jgi:hypothetical protein